MIQDSIRALVDGKSLTREEAAAVAEEIMTGGATAAQIGAFLVALRMKGETAEEVAGMAQVMREKSLHVAADGRVVDVVGTGGDGAGTLNVSTAAALVAAAAGVRVAKHGNRAASGVVGSADIMEANGVKLELSPESVKRCIDEVGIGFMFAPAFHPAMRFAAGPRRELGVRTVFNILGPLTNPAGARSMVLGVPTPELGGMMASVLSALDTEFALVACCDDGLDELTTTGVSQVWEVRGRRVRQYAVTPEDAGLARAQIHQLQVRDAEAAKALFLEALGQGESPAKDIVMLNAAAALVVAGVAADLRAGVIAAREAIDSGAALDKLGKLAELSQGLD